MGETVTSDSLTTESLPESEMFKRVYMIILDTVGEMGGKSTRILERKGRKEN